MSQSNTERNNPVYHTNHPEEPTSPGQNEDHLHPDQNVLYTESTTADPTRMSTCGQNSPSVQGQDMLEATYVAGNEVEHTSTNEDHYMTDINNIPTPESTDVYSESNPIHAENSALYTASGENEDSNTTGNSEEETQVKQADSTVTDGGDITEPYAARYKDEEPKADSNVTVTDDGDITKPYAVRYKDEEPKADSNVTVTDDGDITKPYAVRYKDEEPKADSNVTVTDDGDITKPYAVRYKDEEPTADSTDDGDIKPYAVRYKDEEPKADSTVTDDGDGDIEPYAVCEQTSDDSSHDPTEHVRKLRNPPNAKKLNPNPMYVPNLQQASKLCVNRRCFLVTLVVVLLLVGAITTGVIIGVYHNTQGMQKTMQEVKNLSTLNATELIHVPTIRTFDGTNPPSLGGINGTNTPSLGAKTCERETMRLSCAANELIVIDDAFCGRWEKKSCCGCTLKSCDGCQDVDGRPKSTTLSYIRHLCQGLQQCEKPLEPLFIPERNCPAINKYLEVTYHCEAEVQTKVTFGERGTCYGCFTPSGWGGLAVSSTNEIFVAEGNKRIQVFNMKGDFLRSFSTGNMKPRAMCMGHNDTLWVVLYSGRNDEHTIQQYSKSKEGHVSFTCTHISHVYGIAWHKFSDRIILITRQSGDPAEIVWLHHYVTYTPTPTCNMARLTANFPMPDYLAFVTVDTKGNIYAIHRNGHRILKFDKDGVFLSSFGSQGSGAGNLFYPRGICVDSLGRVIVADTRNSRVEMFTAEGKHIRTIAYINQPAHVATGGEGQLVGRSVSSYVDCLLNSSCKEVLKLSGTYDPLLWSHVSDVTFQE
ncbi:hypothetical protein Bbelb_289390 [Branchiostoma belcheri]|nr:hypothetical protein Bbelb_289390 [Branchiostoma belcheri]